MQTKLVTAFGLDFSAPASLLPAVGAGSDLDCAGSSPGPVDVAIETGRAPRALSQPHAQGLRWAAAPGEYLLEVDAVARYWARNGEALVVDIAAGAKPADVALYLWGPAACALLLQRDDVLALHASAVAGPDGTAVAFAGRSGAGKSSLAAALAQESGMAVLADDLCAVRVRDGQAIVAPGLPQLKLWPDSMGYLGADADTYERLRDGVEKRSVPVASAPLKQEYMLTRIYALGTSPTAESAQTTRVTGSAKVDLLRELTHRRHLVPAFGRAIEHFGHVAATARCVDVVTLHRPQHGQTLLELADTVARELAA